MKSEQWLRARIELRKGQLAQTTDSTASSILILILHELEEALRD